MHLILWKKSGSKIWNELRSESPISWERKTIPPEYDEAWCVDTRYRVILTGSMPVLRPYYSTYVYSYNTTVYGSLVVTGPILGITIGPHSNPALADGSYFRLHYMYQGEPFIAHFHARDRYGRVRNAIRNQYAGYMQVLNIETEIYQGPGGNCPAPPGMCKTNFKSNEKTILSVTDAICIEIAEGDECCDFCALVPKANSIIERLGKI